MRHETPPLPAGEPPQAKFCLECATALALRCANCGTQLPAGAKFCSECATPVGGPGPALWFVSPEAYTPKHLAERIVNSKATLEGERKQVTVLFADLKGSMELLADRDHEEARKILDPVLELHDGGRPSLRRHREPGHGDGVMALFGAAVAREDHAVRACYAAMRMQDSIGRYADELQRTQGVPVHIRVGINSGEVVVRAIGSDFESGLHGRWPDHDSMRPAPKRLYHRTEPRDRDEMCREMGMTYWPEKAEAGAQYQRPQRENCADPSLVLKQSIADRGRAPAPDRRGGARAGVEHGGPHQARARVLAGRHRPARARRLAPAELRRTLTRDQGKEIAEHVQFTIDTHIGVFFCDPHSPGQRGSNENSNGLLRQYFPRDADLSIYTRAALNTVVRELNNRPRQTLGWMKPSEVFCRFVASIG